MPTGVDVFLPNPNKVILPNDMIIPDDPIVGEITDLLEEMELSELAEQIAPNISIAIKNICYGCQGVQQNLGYGLSQLNHQFPNGLCLESAENQVLHALPEAMKLAGIQMPTSDSLYSKLMEMVVMLYKNLSIIPVSQHSDELTVFTF
jgi:hypothetical protein